MLPLNRNTPRDSSSSSFIFEELTEAKTGVPRVSVQKKQSDCQLIPFLKEFQFKPCYLPNDFPIYADEIRNLKIRKDDVWITSFPKSGTVWLTDIVSKLTERLNVIPNKSHAGSSNTHYLEFIYYNLPGNDFSNSGKMEYLQQIKSAPSPRIIVSHLPLQLLPLELWTVKPKMIYIARNPKDVVISNYHMFSNIAKDESRSSWSKEEHFDEFLKENSTYVFGPYDKHVLSFWHLRHLDNFLFLMYEELLADSLQGVKTISKFLKYEFSNEDLEKLTSHVSFDSMKRRNEERSPNLHFRARFFRRGKAGGFVDEMNKEQIEKFDKWIDERFHTFGFKFAI